VSGRTRWDHVKALFQQALERAPAERAPFLRDACGGDEALRTDVESQLAAHDQMGAFVEGSPLKALGESAVASFARVLQRDERLGPYEILAPLGAGGMGEVYKARDTRLDRTVAIKVLPASISTDPEFRSRFDREARAIAALNHPHICTLHDVGHQDGVDFLVMEYLEGQTLADRLTKGAVPLDQALTIAIAIAEALEKAHRQGIVHRDLKPGNVMLTKSGAKLLDFGLAKLRPIGPATPIGGLTASPTATSPLTRQGTIMGTLPYMAPEQVEGKEADTRTDMFAFGTVLYEMVTGRRAFAADSEASLIAAILEREPPAITALQPLTPPLLDHLVQRCLSKDPDMRWQSAHDLSMELRWIASVDTTRPAAALPGRSSGSLWTLSLIVLFIAGGLLGWLIHRPPADTAPTVRFSIVPPESTTLVTDEAPAVSPDGGHVVFVASSGKGRTQLWVRSVDGLVTRALTGTEDARGPFWSPDSEWIGFFAGEQLKRVSAEGGIAQTLCETHEARTFGGAWSPNGTIIFNSGGESGLYRVSAAGGAAKPLTVVDRARRESGHWWPQFMPDGQHFLFAVDTGLSDQDRTGVYVGSLDSPERQLLLHGLSSVAYVPPGYLLFSRDQTLMAQRFDESRLRLIGQPAVVAEGLASELWGGTSLFSASQTGVLAYRTDNSPDSQLTWFGRDGTRLGTLGPVGRWAWPALSPDEKTVAATNNDYKVGDDIWLFDRSRGSSIRFTTEPGWDIGPIWSPDGQHIMFSSNRFGPFNLFRKPSTGASSEELVFESPMSTFPVHWSSNGRVLIYQAIDPTTKYDLWALSLGDGSRTRLVQSPFNDSSQ
jgi:eukaryotic-like serine/threonine-protein kinase